MQLRLWTTLALLAPFTLSIGLNCKGSSLCLGKWDLGKRNAAIPNLIGWIDSIDLDILVGEHEMIACDDNFCAFFQKTNGWYHSIGEAQKLLRIIQDHGCTFCGSVPLEWPLSNDVEDIGELTVNYVAKTCNHGGGIPGVCPDFQTHLSD